MAEFFETNKNFENIYLYMYTYIYLPVIVFFFLFQLMVSLLRFAFLHLSWARVNAETSNLPEVVDIVRLFWMI